MLAASQSWFETNAPDGAEIRRRNTGSFELILTQAKYVVMISHALLASAISVKRLVNGRAGSVRRDPSRFKLDLKPKISVEDIPPTCGKEIRHLEHCERVRRIRSPRLFKPQRIIQGGGLSFWKLVSLQGSTTLVGSG